MCTEKLFVDSPLSRCKAPVIGFRILHFPRCDAAGLTAVIATRTTYWVRQKPRPPGTITVQEPRRRRASGKAAFSILPIGSGKRFRPHYVVSRWVATAINHNSRVKPQHATGQRIQIIFITFKTYKTVVLQKSINCQYYWVIVDVLWIHTKLYSKLFVFKIPIFITVLHFHFWKPTFLLRILSI